MAPLGIPHIQNGNISRQVTCKPTYIYIYTHIYIYIHNWIGHVLRRNFLLQQVTEGKIKAGIEVTGRRGRRCRKLLDFVKERRGYFHLKEEALGRTMWSARFGRGFGPVVRQTSKLIYIYIYICVCVCVCVYIYMYMYTHTCARASARVCVYRCSPLLVHTPSSPNIDLDSVICPITFLRHMCRRTRR